MWERRLTWRRKCTRFWRGHFTRWAVLSSASVIVRTISIPPVSKMYYKQMLRRIYTLYDYFKGYLASHDSLLWLQYAVNWLIGSITCLLFSFLKVQSKLHKVIISKCFIWSSYNIHFVSLHHKYHHHHHHLSIILCNIKLKVSTSPKQPISSKVQVLYHWIWRCLTLDTLTSVSIFSILFFVCFFWYWKREFIWRSMLLRLVIISFILMSLVNDSAVLL